MYQNGTVLLATSSPTHAGDDEAYVAINAIEDVAGGVTWQTQKRLDMDIISNFMKQFTRGIAGYDQKRNRTISN